MSELMFVLIVFPFIAAVACLLIPYRPVRSGIVLLTGAVLTAGAILLIRQVPFFASPHTVLGLDLHQAVRAADFLILLIVLYFGAVHRHGVIISLAVFQIAMLGYLEFFLVRDLSRAPLFFGDHLSLTLVFIVCVVGSIICFQAISYMANHESHLKLGVSRQPRFFFIMLLFLGGMNGVVLANDLAFFYFFFEITTLCSFLLIGHDRTERAVKNAVRALWMNSLGGAAFITAVVVIAVRAQTLDLQQVMRLGGASPALLLPMALFCLAAFTKSAQFPFQSWLLGAMVAPTPVSALLHSSTMVKVGVYLALRIAPALQGLFLSQCLTVFGAFTFLAAAALAVGQSNGKKVLAYSTISNLGLIFACAGMNTAASLTAAMLLILFHAVSKALLFLCVGAIEQRIASRDIEDMRGLYALMPVTALITVAGVITMIMPPFGILLGKWMAMEAAAPFLPGIILIALGSTLTVMYWARWAGILMSDPFAGRFTPETQPILTWGALLALCLGAGGLSLAAPWLYQVLIVPEIQASYGIPFKARFGILASESGAFAVLPLGLVAIAGLLIAVLAVRSARRGRVTMPYLSGLQTGMPRVFKGPMNANVTAEAGNYYLASIFGERRLTAWINIGALMLLTLILGGAL